MPKEYGNRVWAGDPATVAEARIKYDAHPIGQLLPFAVALYSFRTNKKFADELLWLRSELVTNATNFMRTPAAQEYQDRADVLSTYFEWMSRQSALSANQRSELHELADQVCEYGIRCASGGRNRGEHTWYLLHLTAARLLINEKNYKEARDMLNRLTLDAPTIKDANQRARVYRKLGFLYRMCMNPLSGFYWSIKACFVSGVPMAVRVKSAAALLGVDR
jgi:hypothetical protein